jgi:hypothetical protein
MKRKRKFAVIPVVMSGILFFAGHQPLSGQEENKQDLKQYLYPEFTRSSVLMKNGRTMNVMLNYNMVSERMVFEQKGEYFDIINPETADTVYLNDNLFIYHEGVFLEVVQKGKLPFYIQYRGELIQPPRPAGYGTTSQLTSSNVLSGINTPSGYYNLKLPAGYNVRSSYAYWVNIDGRMADFLGQRQFLKLFPDKASRLKKFIKDSKIRFDKPEDIKKLARFCNTEL